MMHMNSPMPIDVDALKDKLVEELNISHLSPEERDMVLDKVAELLMKRATFEVYTLIQQSEHEKIDALTELGKDAEVADIVRKYVPNVQEVAAQAIRDELEEYKKSLETVAAE